MTTETRSTVRGILASHVRSIRHECFRTVRRRLRCHPVQRCGKLAGSAQQGATDGAIAWSSRRHRPSSDI